jgi:RNA polymerase sigma factor (sigma-70 family)
VSDTESSQKLRGFVTAVEREHGRALRRFLSSKLRHASADVADIFQEIFVRLLRVRNHDSILNPQAYLYTIASHVLQQHFLKRTADPIAMGLDESAAEIQAGTAMDPAEEAELQQTIANFGRALEDLSPRAYATLVMYRCEGLTLEEIGRRLGVSRPMARKYLLRAIAFSDQYVEEQNRK